MPKLVFPQHEPLPEPFQISKTLRLAMFSLLLGLDYALGFIPILSIVVDWFILPGVYLMCGLRLMFAFIAFGMLTSLPSVVSGSSASASIVPAVMHPPHIILPFIPILTPIAIGWRIMLMDLTAPLIAGFKSLPMWMQDIDFSLIAGYLLWLQRHIYLENAKLVLRKIPAMISWGIVDAEPDGIFDSMNTSHRQERKLRRKMLGKSILALD